MWVRQGRRHALGNAIATHHAISGDLPQLGLCEQMLALVSGGLPRLGTLSPTAKAFAALPSQLKQFSGQIA